ncbi:MAG TPA: hypothetical protein VMW24_06525 [Sedimentisphaerales bacterium]|nr:hypothetical protein [Sedimentisphaerales bacterium]
MALQEAEIRKNARKFVRDSRQHTTRRGQQERAELYQDFFRGGKHQWSEEEYEAYTSKGVTPITINRCKPVLKALLGMYLQGKQEVAVSPRRGGTAVVGQVHTELLKHTQDVSYADYVYAQVFMRGGIDTEAYLKLNIDRGENVNGQPKIQGLSLLQVDVDRNATEYDLNESAKYVIENEWMDQDEVKALWPHREKEIEVGVSQIDDLDGKPEERLATWMASDSTGCDDDLDADTQIPDQELLKQYRYMVRRVFWKEVKPQIIVADRQGQQPTVKIEDEKKIAKLTRKAKRSVRYLIVNVVKKVLHETVMLGETMLEDTPNPLGDNVSDYPIVRYSPMWDSGYAVGVLDDVVDLNKEENIHRTQTVRILNQTANSGFVVGSANDKKWLAALKKFGSVMGIVIPKDKFGGSVEKITPNQLPAGHFTMAKQFEQDVKRVSGVDDASQGYGTSQSESGRAINLKMTQNRMSNEPFFDNFYRTLEIFGNLLMHVQLNNEFYTNDEIWAIVDESSLIDSKLMAQARFKLQSTYAFNLPQPMMPPPMDPAGMQFVKPQDRIRVMDTMRQGVEGARQYAQAYPQMSETWDQAVKASAIESLLKKLREDKGMYGVKVTISPSAPTERMAQFMQVDALMSKYGQLIPPDVFIDLTDLPEAKREQIKMRLMQAQQAQAQAPQQAQGAAA